MRLSNLRNLFCITVATIFLTSLGAQNIVFNVPSPVVIECGDGTTPEDILAIAGSGPVDGVSTTSGTTDCTAAADNMLTFSHSDIVLPSAECMDGIVIISREWTAMDNCGNSESMVQNIVVSDAVAPTITCRDITLDVALGGMSTIAPEDIVVSAMDDCSGLSTQTSPEISLSQSDFSLCNGSVQVTAFATDGCGNRGQCSSTVTIVSDCPTSLGCNALVNVSLSYDCEAEIRPSLIVEDANILCPVQVRIYDANNVVVRVTDTSTFPYTFPVVGVDYVGKRWKTEAFFEDCSGNEVSCWGLINIEDKIRPRVTCVPDFEVSCKDDLSDLLTSSSTAMICVDGPDQDDNIATATYPLSVSSGNLQPWEVVTTISTASMIPCDSAASGSGSTGTGSTGSGTGSGTGTGGSTLVNSGLTVGGIFSPFTCGDNDIYQVDVITGTSAALLTSGSATVTIPVGTLPAEGLCFTVSTESFGIYNPDNCDPNAEVVITSDVLDENECGNSGFVALRRITYRILDTNGTSSSECSVDINYNAEPLSDIDFPEDFVHSNTPESCIDATGVGPEVTGRPMLEGCALEEGNLCKLNVSFEDIPLPRIGGDSQECLFNFSIRREWVVLDWCLGEFRQHFQSIDVFDVTPPVCIAPIDMTITTTSGCSAELIAMPDVADSPTRLIVDDCSGVNILRVEYTQVRESFSFSPIGGTVFQATPLANNTFRLSDLPIGQSWVRYVIEDGCGNSGTTECFFEVTVVDDNPPIAVCDQFTAVALADNGWGRLVAAAIDDGSYAPCGGDVSIEVRRPSNPCDSLLLDRDDTEYGPYVQFCCAEAGETVPVMLRVTDIGGQSSTCTVSVVIQDKNSDAVVVCPTPSNIVINNCSDLDPTSRFGEPSLSGECAVPEIVSVSDSDTMDADCGVGTFTRTWTIAVNGNVGLVSNCTQTISVTGDDGLTQNSFRFPSDLELSDCSEFGSDLEMFPTIGGVRVTDADLCARLAFSFSDNNFFNVDGYCVKTIRTWTVINWCVYDPVTNPDQGIWTDTQIIKIMNSDGPVFSGCLQDSTVVLIASTTDCNAFANIPIPTATDACFGNEIDASEFAWSVSGPASNTNGVGATASQPLGVGRHTVTWSVEDGCSNVSNCTYTISVEDNSAPVPYCRSSVTTVITEQGQTGMPSVAIWANDFDLGSASACGGSVTASFSPDNLNDTSREFGCNQLGSHTLTVYFTDNNGNQDFCVTTAVIQVNSNICDTIGSIVVDIEGSIFTEQQNMIEDIDVALMNMSGNMMGTALTNINGDYAFENIVASGNYRLEAQSGTDYLKGISTLDLVIIQRHILGIENLASPYKLIAADVNSSEDINGLDLVELRKLILGIYTELPENDSWRFVEEDFVFDQPTQPWPFSEDIEVLQPNQDMTDNDFIAVKIGDVDNSVVDQIDAGALEERNAISVELHNEMLSLENNNYLVPVYFNKDLTFNGLQLSLAMKPGVELVDIESGKLELKESDYLMTKDRLNLALASTQQESLGSEEVLFYLTVEADTHQEDSPYIIDNQRLSAELYDETLSAVHILSGTSKGESPVLFQNVPNPFNGQTLIEFQIPKAGHVVLKLLSYDGRVLRTDEGWYEKGNHKQVWNANDMPEHGVYYYQLEAENHTITKKMIRID